eukprot:3886474-Pyramimonas_sp.AAC.2
MQRIVPAKNPLVVLPVRRCNSLVSSLGFGLIEKVEDVESNHGPQVVGKDKVVLVAAWQAAPSVIRDGAARLAVEGLESQRILMSLSGDMGKTWSNAFVVPTELPNATRPVRHHINEHVLSV